MCRGYLCAGGLGLGRSSSGLWRPLRSGSGANRSQRRGVVGLSAPTRGPSMPGKWGRRGHGRPLPTWTQEPETPFHPPPPNARHISHLLAVWAKEQRENFGLGRMDGERTDRRLTGTGSLSLLHWGHWRDLAPGTALPGHCRANSPSSWSQSGWVGPRRKHFAALGFVGSLTLWTLLASWSVSVSFLG